VKLSIVYEVKTFEAKRWGLVEGDNVTGAFAVIDAVPMS
jgi:hypothetical protein